MLSTIDCREVFQKILEMDLVSFCPALISDESTGLSDANCLFVCLFVCNSMHSETGSRTGLKFWDMT